MRLKVAIIGCGKIADGHIEEIREMPTTARVEAVCDLELLIAEQIATTEFPRYHDRFEYIHRRFAWLCPARMPASRKACEHAVKWDSGRYRSLSNQRKQSLVLTNASLK